MESNLIKAKWAHAQIVRTFSGENAVWTKLEREQFGEMSHSINACVSAPS